MTAPLFGLRREIDRLFESTFTRDQAAGNEWTPAVEIRETDQELLFVVELPGMTLDQIELSAVNGVLTIRGERVADWKDGEMNRYFVAERNYGLFLRRLELPRGVDVDKIKADMHNGVLEVHIPKAALPQPKRILITANKQVNGETANKQVNGEKDSHRAIGHGESRPDSAKTQAAAR